MKRGGVDTDPEAIREYVSQEEPVSSPEVAAYFDIPLQDAADILLQLERDGGIRRKEGGKRPQWLSVETAGQENSDAETASQMESGKVLSSESVHYIQTGDTGEIPETYRLQQLIEELERCPLATPIGKVAGDGDLTLLLRLLQQGTDGDLTQEELEGLTVDEVVEMVIDVQIRVDSPFDALYRQSSLPSGEQLRRVREEFGLSQADVAQETEANQSQLSNLENHDQGISEKRLRDVIEFYRERYEEKDDPFTSSVL